MIERSFDVDFANIKEYWQCFYGREVEECSNCHGRGWHLFRGEEIECPTCNGEGVVLLD